MTKHHDACRKQDHPGDCRECELLRDLDIALAERARSRWRMLFDVMEVVEMVVLFKLLQLAML